MIRPDKILAVDDEPSTLEVYREMLAEDGLALRTAETIVDAVDALDEGDWAVVLLDQRLRGPHGGDEGLTLIDEVHRRSPGAKIIIVTAHARRETIEQAFAAGVYDYVEKTQAFETLLRVKVRNARELVREQSLSSIHGADVDRRLRELWTEARHEPDRNRKGRLLEDLIELLLKQLPGFVASPRVRGLDEEFDIVVRNESTDPFWSREGPYFLVECKNWSSKVGPDELDRFINKLERRYGRARLGFFVAANGFTAGFATTLATRRRESVLVVAIDEQDLEQLVQGPDRDAQLKALHQRAVEAAT